MKPKAASPELPPVEAYRWLVIYGTCAFTVIAESKLDAQVLAKARLGTQVMRSKGSSHLRMEPYGSWDNWRVKWGYFPDTEVRVRRLTDADLDLIAKWNDIPELMT